MHAPRASHLSALKRILRRPIGPWDCLRLAYWPVRPAPSGPFR
jgi:hypothetical protein